MNDIIYLNIEDILTAHRLGLTAFGGVQSEYSLSCIEKRVVEPQTFYFGEEQYPVLFRKAALYWDKLTISHCFIDRNKCVDMIAADLFLKYNGYKIIVDNETLYVYCLLIGNHKTRPTLNEVEDWLVRNTIKLDHNWRLSEEWNNI